MIGFIFNLPHTIIGLMAGIALIPTEVKFKMHPYSFIVKVKRFWWAFGYMRNARAMAIGHTVLLGPNVEPGDLEHELVHVRQYEKIPVIFPILYYIELLRKGYKDNKYEQEAYRVAGNRYNEN